jgi:thiamine biosynthesis lipoprotein
LQVACAWCKNVTVEPRRETRHSVGDADIRRVESIMGTTVSVAVRVPVVPGDVLDRFFDQLRAVDAQFSPYRDDSEVSRLARGELSEAEASPDLRHVLSACDHLALVTEGAFDARRHRPDGRPDPSGYVKGWAIEEAAWILDSAGARNYWVNAGGDIVARGEAAPGRPWRVGIQHPDRRDRVAAVLAVSDRAVATSGSYERGDHIRDPRSGGAVAPSALRSVTVVGPALAFTDAYATALFVMGLDGLHWLASRPDYEALAITADDRVVRTQGMERYLVRGA